jgi:CRISPR-associated protein Cmr6
MPYQLHIPEATRNFVKVDASGCDNRSLFQDRYAAPLAKEEDRKSWYNALIKKSASLPATFRFANSTDLYARLCSRLMVNKSNGVMENAHVCLDRYGVPYIPGTAIKGCARRMALQALRDWTTLADSQILPDDDLSKSLCDDFKNPIQMLVTIAHTFGWVELDWKDKADLHWACNGKKEILDAAKEQLPHNKQFAGSIAFLPAYPNADPGIELDVLTCHHPKYYEGKDTAFKNAPDTEEPNPVIFLAVRPQLESNYFAFQIIALRSAEEPIIAFAKKSLAQGLEIFGLGAKTAAGYGFFDASQELQGRVTKQISDQEKRRETQAEQNAEKVRLELVAKEKIAAKEALSTALEGLTDEQKEDKKIELLNDSQFDNKVRSFCKEIKKGGPSDIEKQAIVRALRGPRVGYWTTFKTKATKGDLATVDQAIRALSKTLNLGKMP